MELTERQQLHDLDRVRSRIDACRRAGIRFAADDIGAGNAGLRLLAEIRFDILKVDLTLVQRSASEGPSSAVLESVVELAARTGALVVAEGIEHESQLGAAERAGHHRRPGLPTSGRPGLQLEALSACRSTRAGPPSAMADWRQSMGLHLGQLSAAAQQAAPPRATQAASSAGPSPAASHTMRGSRRNQVSWRFAYCRVRRAVTSIACSSDHSPAR